MYNCDRCGYTSKFIDSLKKHLKRKKICSPIYSNIDISELKKKYCTKDKTYKCEYCNNIFETSMKKYTHKLKCKNDNENDYKNKIKTLENEITELKNIVKNIQNNTINNNTTNNNTTNNNTTNNNIDTQNNNIIINNFGNESLEHITKEFLDKCLLRMNTGIKDLIKNIHFNDNIPENKNIKFKSERYNLLQKYENGEWLDCDKNNTLDELIHKGFKILNQHYFKSKDENEKLKEYKDVIMNFFCELIQQSSNDYFSLRRDIFITVKNNTAYLVGK